MSEDRSAARVHVRAPGKINLFFEVGDLQPDGYHNVASVYQAVALFEDVWAELSDRDEITVDGDVDVSGVPLDASNLALRAAHLVARSHDYMGGVRLSIRKGVPVAGGMGGGSADAAATLVAVNELLGGELTLLDLQRLGAELGADVPFALRGGTAVGTGRGDELAAALARGTFWWVLTVRDDGLSTPAVYGELDRIRGELDIRPRTDQPDVEPRVLQALRAGSAVELGGGLRNDLQKAAIALKPELQQTIEAGEERGSLASFVSGSGPTVVHLASDAGHAEELAQRLSNDGWPSFAVHGPASGARIVS